MPRNSRPKGKFTGSKNHPRRHHNTTGQTQVRKGLCELQVQDMARRMGILYSSTGVTEAVLTAYAGRKVERCVFTNDPAFCDLLRAHGIWAQYIKPTKWQHRIELWEKEQAKIVTDEASWYHGSFNTIDPVSMGGNLG